MKVAICEDELVQQEHLRELIKEWEDQTKTLMEAEFFTSGESFLTAWDTGKDYDLVFLDIHMTGLDGMKTAKKIRERDEKITLVFLTSRIEYVLKGYEVNAWRYLIKPVHQSEFFLCLNKAKEMAEREEEVMIIHSNNRYYRIAYDAILYIESFGHFVEIHTADRMYEMRAGISQIELKLPKQFFRCHRSYLINLSYVTEVEEQQVVIREKRIALSAKKRAELLRYLQN